MGRSPCCDKAAVKRGPWTAEEDARLRSYIEQHGTGGNWIALPGKVGLRRCGKSCRLRWLNYLRPDIRHGGFSDHEDRLICALYAAIGSRWSNIAAQLPGRTDNDVKNYWNTHLKKRLFFPNNAGKPKPPPPPPPPPLHAPLLPHATNHPHVATTSGTGGMHVVFAGGGHLYAAATSYSSGATTAGTELDEIFRSTGTSSGDDDGSSSARSSDALTMMNWHSQRQSQGELQGVQQQQQHQHGLPYF